MMLRNKKKQDIHEGKWNGLGGKLEQGETPEECAKREVLEESGLVVHKLVLKGFLTFPLFKDNEDWYVFLFRIDEATGELIESAEGTLAWIDHDKLLELNLWPGDRLFLPYLDEPGIISGSFSYVNKELVDHHLVHYPEP